MEMAMATMTANGAPALTAAGVAAPLLTAGKRGGALTALNGALVGPRGIPSSRTFAPGMDGQVLADMVQAVLDEGMAEGIDEGMDQAKRTHTDLVVFMFHVLDILDGKGERSLFVRLFLQVYAQVPALRPALLRLLPAIPHYGCWRTLATLFADADADVGAGVTALFTADDVPTVTPHVTALRAAIVELWARTLAADWEKLRPGSARASLTQAGKWAPSLAGAVNRDCGLGDAIADELCRMAPAIMNPEAATGSGARDGAGARGGADMVTAALAETTLTEDAPVEVQSWGGSMWSALATLVGGGAAHAPPVPKGPSPVAAATLPTGAQAFRRAQAMRYRQLLSKLRAALNVPEVKMAGRQWADLDPTAVPALANNKYKAALQNVVGAVLLHPRSQDDRGVRGGIDLASATKRTRTGGEETREEKRGGSGAKKARTDDPDRVACAEHYAASVSASLAAAKAAVEGGETAKVRVIKGARNQVHELVATYMQGEDMDPLVEAMWADLVTQMRAKGALQPAVAVVDVSASMTGQPMTVAIALGILLAQLQPVGSPFRNRVLTFHTTPTWVDIGDCNTLHAAVECVRNAPWGGSTSFARAMELVLCEARGTHHVPTHLFVFSDMQFDAASGQSLYGAGSQMIATPPLTIFGIRGVDIREAYAVAEVPVPQIIFWNLSSGVPTFQADAGVPGIALVSGFSQEVMRQFMTSGDLETAAGGASAAAATAAWEQVAAVLAAPRYDRVRAALAALT